MPYEKNERDDAGTTPGDSGAVRVPDKVGAVSVPFALTDNLLPRLTPDEQSVYLRLFRLAAGTSSVECVADASGLARACNMSEERVTRALAVLVAARLVEERGTRDAADPLERGTVYAILPYTRGGPSAVPLPAPDSRDRVYRVREIAVQLHEMHRDDRDYTPADLRRDVRETCAVAGIACDDELLEAALGRVGL